jgi:hypothetical protein
MLTNDQLLELLESSIEKLANEFQRYESCYLWKYAISMGKVAG